MDLDQIITTAIRFASEGGVPIWAVLAFALVAAIIYVALGKVKLPKPPPAGPPEPTNENDGGGPEVTDAVMDDNVVQNTDPNTGPPG